MTETKVCAHCREEKPLDAFATDRSRSDGVTRWCRACRNDRARRAYKPVAKPLERARRFVAARDGDARQARRRVNYLVDLGVLPNPNEVACVDCGHLDSDKRHEYDHFLGYDAANHEKVEAVCSTCHHARVARRIRELVG